MTVCGTAFFMKSVKASTPTVAIVLTKLTYITILYTANCIIYQQVSYIKFAKINCIAQQVESRIIPRHFWEKTIPNL